MTCFSIIYNDAPSPLLAAAGAYSYQFLCLYIYLSLTRTPPPLSHFPPPLSLPTERYLSCLYAHYPHATAAALSTCRPFT